MKNVGIQLVDNNDSGEILDLKVIVTRGSDNKIVSGLVIGNILEQNKGIILIAHQGELKATPDLGVGLGDLLMSNDHLEYRHKIREHFAKDSLIVRNVQLENGKPLLIDASYG